MLHGTHPAMLSSTLFSHYPAGTPGWSWIFPFLSYFSSKISNLSLGFLSLPWSTDTIRRYYWGIDPVCAWIWRLHPTRDRYQEIGRNPEIHCSQRPSQLADASWFLHLPLSRKAGDCEYLIGKAHTNQTRAVKAKYLSQPRQFNFLASKWEVLCLTLFIDPGYSQEKGHRLHDKEGKPAALLSIKLAWKGQMR